MYNTNEERLIVKGSERITHDLKVNGSLYVDGNIALNNSIGSEGEIITIKNGTPQWQPVSNTASYNDLVANNAQIGSLDVSALTVNNTSGNDGQVLGVVNGNLEWFTSTTIDTNDFVVNRITINDSAKINNYDVTAFTVMMEDDYNNLPLIDKRKGLFYLTQPNGNLYFKGYSYLPNILSEPVYSVWVNMGSQVNTVTTQSLVLSDNSTINNYADRKSVV